MWLEKAYTGAHTHIFPFGYQKCGTTKATYRFNAILIKTPTAFFAELEQITLNFLWIHKRPQADKSILRKRSKAGGVTLLVVRLHYKAAAIETMCGCPRVHIMSSSFFKPGTVACQVPLSMEFSRQEYCSGLPSPTLGDLLEPGIKLTSPGSCIGGHILYHCTSWEAPSKQYGTDAQIKGTWWRPQKQTHDLWSVNLQQRRQEYTLEGR